MSRNRDVAGRDMLASMRPLRALAETFSGWKMKVDHWRVTECLSKNGGEGGLVRDRGIVRADIWWLLANQPGPRLDLYVRVLAVEEFAGLNSVGSRLYSRFMANPRSKHRSSEKFAGVFNSVVARGLLESEPLVLHASKILGDGWHRLACAIFLGIPRVAVTCVTRHKRPHIYTVETLRERGFEEREIELVLDAEKRTMAWLRPASPKALGSVIRQHETGVTSGVA
jgi:hypothetical protein